MNISITKTTHPIELTPSDKLGFGIHYTDHMFIMDYSDEKGWHDARIVPFQDISLSPAACVFHYGAEVFEGLKAYRRKDGKVQLFRPWDNMERMKNSAIRLGLPVVPPEDALEAVKALVKLDGAPFKAFAAQRDRWAMETDYVYPGPIQYFGPTEVCDQATKTLQLEQAK